MNMLMQFSRIFDCSVIESATQAPFIVRTYVQRPDGSSDGVVEVVERMLNDPPIAEDIVPAEHFVRWASIYPATRFDEMDECERQSHAGDYRTFLLWRKARAIGKTVAQLVPWTDYDAIAIDEAVERWKKPVGRYAGD